tara:strand:- start:3755 stop:3946 length:192 start_codon:yes stop_codon:yes gene_type:complete
MRGIYITKRVSDIISGYYLSMKRGKWRVHTFKNCSLEFVIQEASLVIHDPQIFTVRHNQQKGA